MTSIRRISLITLVAALSITAMGREPVMYEDVALSSVSPNGIWAAGQVSEGMIAILNMETGKQWRYSSNGGSINYFLGIGNVISNDGTVIGATRTDDAAYWKDGKWTTLQVPHPEFVNNTGSITPDGSVICGGIGLATMASDADDVMLGPAVWYRQDDGSYGMAVPLPHPMTDFTGRLPQYVTAIAISDDGKTVGGKIVDYTGYVSQPIIYTCDDNGEWTYTVFGEDLINPRNTQFPEWPGDLDEDILMPTPEWYMTPEQLEAFMEAFEEWDNTGTPPLYQDFMTPEQIAEYNAAMKEYIAIVGPWQEKFNAFMDVYYSIIRNSSTFAYNNERISPDGKYYLTTVQMRGSSSAGRSGSMPLLYDIKAGTYETFPSSLHLTTSGITADYSILAYTPASGMDTGTRKGYIFPKMAAEPISIYDYLSANNPDLGVWMTDNMTHEIALGLDDNYELVTEVMLSTGIPIATPDLSLVITYNSTLSWWDYFGPELISFVMPGTSSDGVKRVTPGSGLRVELLPDGTLLASGPASTVDVYDITGRRVLHLDNPSESTATDLPAGIYIIRATAADGSVSEGKYLRSRN